MTIPTTPSKSMGTKLNLFMKGAEELWNCFGSKSRSSVGGKTPGDKYLGDTPHVGEPTPHCSSLPNGLAEMNLTHHKKTQPR
ncbi:hypothetical protein CR513_18810, partial [Mucuna pruriens]